MALRRQWELACHGRPSVGKHADTQRRGSSRGSCDDIRTEARNVPRPVMISDLRGRTRFMDRSSCANLLPDKGQRNGSKVASDPR
jgi:hypothetical protein